MEQFYYITACVMFAVFGLCIGSFLNVVIYRLPRGMNLAKPASHCTTCGHKLAWYDNIPLLSYLILRGKCRYCGASVSPRYFVVEFTNCVLWLMCPLTMYFSRGVWFSLVCALAISLLLAMSLIDMENLFIPDSLQICFFLVAVGGIFADGQTGWQDKLYGLLLGGGFFLFFYCASFVLFKREGMGFGDVKLMASAGLLLGWKATIAAIVFAIAVALADIVLRKIFIRSGRDGLGNVSEEFAFAPYLALGVFAAMLFGNALVDGYLALFV